MKIKTLRVSDELISQVETVLLRFELLKANFNYQELEDLKETRDSLLNGTPLEKMELDLFIEDINNIWENRGK